MQLTWTFQAIKSWLKWAVQLVSSTSTVCVLKGNLTTKQLKMGWESKNIYITQEELSLNMYNSTETLAYLADRK